MVSYPGGLDSLTNPASTDLLTSPGHALQHSNANDILEALERQAGTRGTSFPSSPTAEDRFWYETLNEEFEWNGTLWLSKTLRVAQLHNTDALLPFTSSTAAVHRGPHPFPALDIRIEDWYVGFHVAGGGSALSASHKWTIVLNKAATTGLTAIGTITIDSGSSGVWRSSILAIDATAASDILEYDAVATKTGTPGGLYSVQTISYRLVFS